MKRPAVFLDRDGTLNVKPPRHCYVRSAAQFFWMPGAQVGAAMLARAGYVLTVVSNQRGVAGGLVDDAILKAIEVRVQDGLTSYGCRIEAFRYCPHDVHDHCWCRKPRPGLILELAKDLDLDLSRSWMIGDSKSDVLAGAAAGCRTILLADTPRDVPADVVVPSILEAGRFLAKKARAA
jgi:D-glycero-D-manno-heptose 1,7-bisphosphate phosphatase